MNVGAQRRRSEEKSRISIFVPGALVCVEMKRTLGRENLKGFMLLACARKFQRKYRPIAVLRGNTATAENTILAERRRALDSNENDTGNNSRYSCQN